MTEYDLRTVITIIGVEVEIPTENLGNWVEDMMIIVGSTSRISIDPPPIEVHSLNMTCNACPSQWDGITKDNRRIYIRYRHGFLSVRIGKLHDMSRMSGVEGDEVFDWHSDGSVGDEEMDLSDLRRITMGVLTLPESYLSFDRI